MLLPPNAPVFPALAVLLLPLARGQVVFPTPGLNPFSVCSAATVGAAVYIMSNEDFNTVISLPIAPDGRISIGTVTATGGAGAVGLGADGKPVGGDALFSQSSLIVAGGALFAVNAGSNTLSMFAIDDANPAVLRLLGTPAAVPGDFPNTVAVSLRHKLACVATTGKRSGVSCANFSLSKGLGAFDALRDFDFTNDLRQSTPPVGPPNTVSHAFFSEDQSQLLVTVKGDPASNSRNGFVARYDVNGASCDLNAAGMRNPARIYTGYLTPVDGMKLPFGSVVIPDSKDIKTKGRILVTDPSFGAAIISPKTPSLGFNVDTRIVIGGGKAICWATTSPATGTIFVTDGAVNRLVEISPDDGRILSILDLSSTGAGGLLDIVGAGNYLYSLSAGSAQASITVVDVSRGKQTQKLHQHLSLGSLAGKRAMGMAALLD